MVRARYGGPVATADQPNRSRGKERPMALTWEFTAGEDVRFERREKYPPREDDTMNSVTNWLIMSTMLTRVYDWTTLKNRDEAYRRIAFYEALFGAVVQTDKGPRPITREDVEAHRGLVTNAFPMDSWKKYTANLAERWGAEQSHAMHSACRHDPEIDGGFCTVAYDGRVSA